MIKVRIRHLLLYTAVITAILKENLTLILKEISPHGEPNTSSVLQMLVEKEIKPLCAIYLIQTEYQQNIT